MNIAKGKIGNALTSTASDHVVAVANDVYDENLGKYQSEVNEVVLDEETGNDKLKQRIDEHDSLINISVSGGNVQISTDLESPGSDTSIPTTKAVVDGFNKQSDKLDDLSRQVYENTDVNNILYKEELVESIHSSEEFVNNGFFHVNGAITAVDTHKYTDYIQVDMSILNKLEVCCLWGNQYGGGIRFYNNTRHGEGWDDRIGYLVHKNSTFNDNSVITIYKNEIPEGTLYIRANALKNGATAPFVKIYNIVKTEGLVPDLETEVKEVKNNVASLSNTVEDVTKQTSDIKESVDNLYKDETVKIMEVPDADFSFNGFIYSDGRIVEQDKTTWKLTDYIPIEPKEGLVIDACVLWSNSYGAKVAFYDANKTFISLCDHQSGEANKNTLYRITNTKIPSNARYIRGNKANVYGVSGSAYINVLISEKSGEIVEINKKINEISSIKEDVFEYLGYNQVCQRFDEKGYDDNGNLIDKVGHFASDIVPILDGIIAYGSNYDSSNLGASACFYDADKVFISKVLPRYGGFTKPINAAYVSFDIEKSLLPIADAFPILTRRIHPTMWCFTPSLVKVRNSRTVVNIYPTDDEITIVNKMFDALLAKDCDVIFHYGTYIFTEVAYDYISDLGLLGNRAELQLGGNCHYYLNNSTIIGRYNGSKSLIVATLGWAGKLGSFEIQDGTVISENIYFTMHIDPSGANQSLNTANDSTCVIKNLHIKYGVIGDYIPAQISSPLAIATTEPKTRITVKDCVIESQSATNNYAGTTNHGMTDSREGNTYIEISNCYLHHSSFGSVGENENCELVYTNNSVSFLSLPSSRGWDVKEWNNNVRQ